MLLLHIVDILCINWDGKCLLIEGEWRMYASVTYTSISSESGWRPGRWPAITWTNAGISLIGNLGPNL